MYDPKHFGLWHRTARYGPSTDYNWLPSSTNAPLSPSTKHSKKSQPPTSPLHQKPLTHTLPPPVPPLVQLFTVLLMPTLIPLLAHLPLGLELEGMATAIRQQQNRVHRVNLLGIFGERIPIVRGISKWRLMRMLERVRLASFA
jgi:hypothetical protein